ncbi:CAF17-like 4Fe-4S cluster assembly/insertion protein YgfZ [Facilibium subflavum]|uniref:CAF17-like 4Fe-4S cluster assembly/insertion protein YgfZ n=1 Tax=Facilibium subflavum TaxID=2219058 RepID=UPI000E653AF1|nr:amino acid transporter [Facilibium subflavum]
MFAPIITQLVSVTMAYFIYDNMQAIDVYGHDCTHFLQGQLTNDLTVLSAEIPLQLNALCNLKGRVISLFFVRFIAKNRFIIMLPQNLADRILNELQKYAVFSKISFEPVKDYHLVFSNTKPRQDKHNWLFQHAILHRNEINSHIQSTLTWQDVQKENICQQLSWVDSYNSEKFLPAELNLDQFKVIAYDKGCFKGQEVIARMKYRGTLKKELISLKVEGMAEMQDKLFDPDHKVIADIVNMVIVDNKAYILAVFNQSNIEKGIILADDLKTQIIA